MRPASRSLSTIDKRCSLDAKRRAIVDDPLARGIVSVYVIDRAVVHEVLLREVIPFQISSIFWARSI